MTGLDMFVISFGIAFLVASDRFKQGVALLRGRAAGNTRNNRRSRNARTTRHR